MKRRGAIGRRRLAGAATLARIHGLAPSRAERFRSRRQSDVPLTAAPAMRDLTTWPAWPLQEDPVRRTIFILAALLASREALSGLISGSSLRVYAALIGEDMLERVLDWPQAGTAPLPAAGELENTGRAIAAAELPPQLADAIFPGNDAPTEGDIGAAGTWIAEAEKLMTTVGRL